MATIKRTQGTAITWTSSGGNYAITATSLASGSYRQGAKGDLTASFADSFDVAFYCQPVSAPTAGTTADLYWAASTSATAGTDNPGGCDGTDSAYVGYGAAATDADEAVFQLEFLGSVIFTADSVQQVARMRLNPVARYGMPVIKNVAGVALHGTGTNIKVVLTPAHLTDA